MNIDTFWESLDYSGECWTWKNAKHLKGYGAANLNGRNGYAHRFAWEIENGPIPDGLKVLHRCDNPPCCRPSHLFLGTLIDNNADMVSKGRNARGEMLPAARLTDSAVISIRHRYADGERQYLLAREFGVTNPTIHRVVHGHAWKHLLKETA